jgi:ribosomal protein S18 acetylase RimI-like enzyme
MSEDIPLFTVRTADQEDSGVLAHFFSLFDDRSLSPTQISRRLEDARDLETVFLAVAARPASNADPGEQVLGMASVRVVACLSADDPQAQITELYVEKDWRGGGIEQALLARVETLAAERGAEEISLLTGLRNTAAQGLFRSLGYRDYALTMRKHLR